MIAGILIDWLLKREKNKIRKRLRRDRKWAELMLVEDDSLVQIDYRVPVDGELYLLEDYYGCGLMSDAARAHGIPCRIVVRMVDK